MEKNKMTRSWKMIFGFLAGILFVIPILAFSQAAGETSLTGLMIPLYGYPSPEWDKVVAAKTAHPSVPVIVIINPNSGPGTSQDANFVTGIQKLKSAGIIVLGYVPTDYTTRSASSVMADINSYKNWYLVDGIKFDEMTNTAGHETYYSNLSAYAKSLGFTLTAGNPGADTLPSYIGTVDIITIFENSYLPDLSSLGGWHSDYDKKNFSTVSYGISSLDQAFVTAESQYVGYTYLTDDNQPNPFDSTSSYLNDLMLILDSCSDLPPVGDWIVSSSCTLTSSSTAHGNVIIQNGAVLTIPNGISLDIDFTSKHLLVKSGSGVLIKAGGKIY